MPTINPTHSCFDDAIDFISWRVTNEPALAHGTSLRLVHGIATAPADAVGVTPGAPFAHAWVEEDVAGADEPVVWQSGVLNGERVMFSAARSEFYVQLGIREATVYTIAQVWEENVRSGTYGPWRAEYLALCGRRGSLRHA